MPFVPFYREIAEILEEDSNLTRVIEQELLKNF